MRKRKYKTQTNEGQIIKSHARKASDSSLFSGFLKSEVLITVNMTDICI